MQSVTVQSSAKVAESAAADQTVARPDASFDLIGFVQAFVFTLLVSVYIGLICNHGDDHGHEEHGHDGHRGGEAAAH